MSTPFASKLFESSSKNSEGWDEWDWVENNNVPHVAREQQQQQHTNQQQNQIVSQNLQSQIIDNATNQFNSTIPPPMMDQSFQSTPTTTQYNTILANNNHINATAFHQDVSASHQHQPQHQQPMAFANFQNSNNNFMQSSTLNYLPRPNSAGFVQVENNERTPIIKHLPPVPARPPSTTDHSSQQNTQVGFTAFPNVQSESQLVSSTAEASSSPISAFDSNALAPVFPPVLPPPSLNQPAFANTNPFKRVGSHAHRTPPPPPQQLGPSGPVVSTSIMPDTSSHQSERAFHSQESNEPIAHNDRNEYLQTGHLSEDGENNTISLSTDTNAQYSSSDGNGDSLPLPPPGLSRLVLGEQETNESTSAQPPPGLDRLVTGTEISQSNINLERQADGQDNTGTKVSQIIRSNQFTSVPTLPLVSNLPPTHLADSEMKSFNHESDRNQYLVAGENVVDSTVTAAVPVLQNVNMHRVVTGLENDENHDQMLPNHQRDINMDGENIEDQQQQQQLQQLQQQQQQQQQQQHQHQHQQQQQPHQSSQNKFSNTPNTVSLADSAEDLATSGNFNQKNPSNASSPDDSDREKEHYSRSKGQPNKKTEDRRKKRDDSRYETEDTDHSTKERRRSKEIDRYVEKERGYRGRSVDIDENDSHPHRQRGEKLYRGEKNYRPPSRDDDDRYEGRYRYGEGRSHRDSKYRYETDGSHYERDDARHEHSSRRRNDRDRDRERENYGRYHDDRYYRSKDDRDNRDERDRYRGRDERLSDYEHMNKSRRDRKKDRVGNGSERGDYPSGYYHLPVNQFGYDPYSSYYQNQQYYENLRLTNPIAYAEWYNRYFAGQLTAAASTVASAARNRDGKESGRESVHSGRSSTKDNDRYMLSATKSFYHSYGMNHTYSLPHSEFSSQHNSTMLDNASSIVHQRHQYASSDIGSHSSFTQKLSQLNVLNDTATSLEPDRMTPLKFASVHSSASFQDGVLVCVKQKYLASSENQNNVQILKFGLNNQTKRLYQMYPGPLTPVTHTKQVIDFCLEQIRNGPVPSNVNSRSTSNSMSSLNALMDQTGRASFSLLWNFLVLLLRQRGVFVGSDIAELLLKNKDEFPYEQHQLNSTKISTSRKDCSDGLSDADSKDDSNDAFSNDSEQPKLSEKEITEKFRQYLLYGSINEALEWATDNNLWGHALFLASKMDRRSHANVMIKFANKLPLADPLQTLYQLKSGRIPLSVTSTQDEKWGDWRPHLAMIISNPSQSNAELDRKSIITMGDTLYNRGELFGAQFCYLMGKVEFSKYSDVKNDVSMILNSTTSAVRLILLGASCYKTSFADFAADEAIIMTEIYEYACALANNEFSIVEFQPYKYLLGVRMLDYGFHLKSLLYMEQIALHIQRNPSQYERSFIEKVYNLADKLKYYDPIFEKNLDNLDEEDGALQNSSHLEWQQDLANLLGQNRISENLVPLISTNSDPYQQQQQPISLPTIANSTASYSHIDQEFTQINQQFQDLSLQYQNPSYEYGHTAHNPAADTGNYIDSPNQYGTQQNLYESSQQPSDLYSRPHQIDAVGSNTTGFSDSTPQLYQQQQTYNDTMSYDTSNYGAAETIIERESSNASKQANIHYINTIGMQPQMLPTLNRLSEQEEDEDDGDGDGDGDYDDIEEGCEDDVLDNVPRPQISMPNSFSNKPGFYDDGDSPASGSSKKPIESHKPTQDLKKKQNGPNDNAKSGWIGGIFNKLSFKPKNQMILPDDKNPSIIWDAQNQKWVNKDQDEDENETFRPPPKLMELPAMQQTISKPNLNIPTVEAMPSYKGPPTPMLQETIAPSNNESTTPKVPNLQSNMFKMQRNKTLKKSYVDVFNPGGAAPKNDTPLLAPIMPAMPAQANMNFFVPASVPNTNQQNQEEQSGFYNPNQYSGYQQ